PTTPRELFARSYRSRENVNRHLLDRSQWLYRRPAFIRDDLPCRVEVGPVLRINNRVSVPANVSVTRLVFRIGELVRVRAVPTTFAHHLHHAKPMPVGELFERSRLDDYFHA